PKHPDCSCSRTALFLRLLISPSPALSNSQRLESARDQYPRSRVFLPIEHIQRYPVLAFPLHELAEPVVFALELRALDEIPLIGPPPARSIINASSQRMFFARMKRSATDLSAPDSFLKSALYVLSHTSNRQSCHSPALSCITTP
ncbi:MAG: hypothetical protein U0K19_02715, partial [Bifidobacteriaceae bacterium]|nr:hypothetical protein [Bifidobacteriaceae bacterium]